MNPMSLMSAFVKQLNFARLMSLLAIFIALGAGAYAAGLKRNSVKSKQIKDGAVQTQDIGDGAITAAKVLHGTITGADVANDSLIGDQVAEGTLQIDTVGNADRVNGLQVRKINLNMAPSETQQVNFGDKFRLDPICSSTGVLAMGADTLVSNSYVESTGMRAYAASDLDGATDINSNVDPDYDVGDFFVIDMPDAFRNWYTTIRYLSSDGFVVVVRLVTLDEGGRCKIWGTAVSG